MLSRNSLTSLIGRGADGLVVATLSSASVKNSCEPLLGMRNKMMATNKSNPVVYFTLQLYQDYACEAGAGALAGADAAGAEAGADADGFDTSDNV